MQMADVKPQFRGVYTYIMWLCMALVLDLVVPVQTSEVKVPSQTLAYQ